MYFDEFKIFSETIQELENEYYQGLIIINYLPMKALLAFKTLNRFAHTQIMIYDKSDEEQIELLRLLCKFANKQQIEKILELLVFNDAIWLKIMDENFDVKDYFSNGEKVTICNVIAKMNPNLEKEKYFSYYGLFWFQNLPKYNISTSKKDHGVPQKRIYDKISQTNYLMTVMDDKIILSNPLKHVPITKNPKRFYLQSDSESDEDEQDLISDKMILSKLSQECINERIFHNFIICDVNVHCANNNIVMQLIETTEDDGYRTFVRTYRNDFRKLYAGKNNSLLEYMSSISDAWKKYSTTGIYVPPTIK